MGDTNEGTQRGWRGDGAPHLARSARPRRDTRTEWGCHSDRIHHQGVGGSAEAFMADPRVFLLAPAQLNRRSHYEYRIFRNSGGSHAES